jgi:hypothetical protein
MECGIVKMKSIKLVPTPADWSESELRLTEVSLQIQRTFKINRLQDVVWHVIMLGLQDHLIFDNETD